jgi:hypothetical protein
VCGAIIVFPASVGAICELGLFAGVEGVAKKTLAIVHSDFQNHTSFFRVGLLKIFKMRYGSQEFANYSSHDVCVQKAIEFVDERWTKLNLDSGTIADAEVLMLEQKGGNFEKRG